jgi:hypothetical protein
MAPSQQRPTKAAVAARRPPQLWSAIIDSGVFGVALCLVMLITATWVAIRDGVGNAAISVNWFVVALAALATTSTLGAVIHDRRGRSPSANSLPRIPGRITYAGNHPHRKHGAEAVVYRSRHGVSQVTVFIDGQRVPLVRTHEISTDAEPGAYDHEQWQQMAAAAAGEPGASQAWSEQVRAWYDEAEVAMREPDRGENSP